MLTSSRFNGPLHAIADLTEYCFRLLGWVLKEANVGQRYILDTFPVKVCHRPDVAQGGFSHIRISRSHLLPGEGYRGKNASKREYFYGYKVALLIRKGLPVELAFIAGSYGQHSALARLEVDLPQGSIIWQDSGFTDYEWEDFYAYREGMNLPPNLRKTFLRGDSFIEAVATKQNRKSIETNISEITARLGKKIHALTMQGFQFKVFLLILAFSLIKYITL